MYVAGSLSLSPSLGKDPVDCASLSHAHIAQNRKHIFFTIRLLYVIYIYFFKQVLFRKKYTPMTWTLTFILTRFTGLRKNQITDVRTKKLHFRHIFRTSSIQEDSPRSLRIAFQTLSSGPARSPSLLRSSRDIKVTTSE